MYAYRTLTLGTLGNLGSIADGIPCIPCVHCWTVAMRRGPHGRTRAVFTPVSEPRGLTSAGKAWANVKLIHVSFLTLKHAKA